jgi:protoporphyrinogen oxidase
LESCKKLKYRHHIGVKLVVTGKLFPDNWIYIHDPKVIMARVSNYLNFSKDMSLNKDHNPLTIEYFCFENDDVWKLSDKELKELAEKELRETKLINDSNKVVDGFIVRSLNAYPVIKKGYQKEVDNIINYLSRFDNLFPIGRSGMFKYNNQDHAIATGLYAARNLENEKHKIDIWQINSEGVYQEGEIETNK